MRAIHSGFTLVEVIVAVIILGVGVLGYTAAAANISRSLYVNARRARAADAVVTQREILLRRGCSAAASGSETRAGIPIRWEIGALLGGVRTATVIASRANVTSLRVDSLQAALPCK